MPYLILGAGGMAVNVLYYLSGGDVCFLDEITTLDELQVGKRKFQIFHCFEDVLASKYRESKVIPGVADCALRHRLVTQAIDSGFELSDPIVHPTALLFDTTVGKGTVVCPYVIITHSATIGNCCLVNLHATIGHDSIINDFTTINPGAHISGNVTIGNRVFVGSGAFIKEKLTIGNNVVIGAQACVVRDVEDGRKVMGVPAR